MAEAKKAAKAASESFTASEALKSSAFPQFDLSRLEFPRFEVPAAYREMAEKGLAQTKQNYERMKTAAEETSELVENTFACATKGLSDYNLKVIESARANMNANLDFIASLFAVKSPSEVVELSSAHARKTFEAVSEQGKELASLAQKVSSDTAEPIRAGLNKALRPVA